MDEDIHYDTKTGYLFRKHKDKFNHLKAVSVVRGVPYIGFTYKYKRYYAHRYIWERFNGKIPKGMVIDHVNGDSLDNRIENLRCVTQSKNLLNRNNRLRSDNSSGVRGVSYNKRDKVWVATININYKHIFLGQAKSKEEAIKIRKKAEQKI